MKPISPLRSAFAGAGAAIALLLSGCANDDFLRIEGVTTGAGDAAASNSVMQMVDPWQRGVEDTDLRVPAERPVVTSATNAGKPDN